MREKNKVNGQPPYFKHKQKELKPKIGI